MQKINVYNTMNKTNKTVLVKEKELEYEGNKLDKPEIVAQFMREVFSLHLMAEEYVYLLAFNNAMRPVGVFEVSHGTVNASFMSPREIFLRALLCGASSVILTHNHPGESPVFSREDLQTTKRLREAGDLIGIKLLDHVLIAGHNYKSACEDKLL